MCVITTGAGSLGKGKNESGTTNPATECARPHGPTASLEARGQSKRGVGAPAETKDEHINHDSLKLQHRKALKAARLRSFEVYSIRHAFLTRLGESGCDVWTFARIAGHSNISIS